MSLVKQVFAVLRQSFRKWTTDYRIWTIFILIFIMINENVRSLASLSEKLGENSTVWIFPFLYSQFHLKLIFTLPLVLLYCNAPFIEQNSLFIISRCGKMKYTIGQISYIVISALFYYIFIFAVSIILSLPYADISNEWGKILNIIAYTDVSLIEGFNFLDSSGMVITYFKPFQAVLFTILMSVLFAVVIGLIIYAANIITKTKYIGCLISSLIIVFSSFGEVWGNKKFLPYSPASWITLDKLDVGGLTSNPTFTYCLTVYLVTIVILTALILVFGRKQTVDAMK